MNTQNASFVTSHLLGQTYASENSNFGPIYHHHAHHNTLTATTAHPGSYTTPYDKYKMSTSPHHTANPYGSPYQGFYGHPQMVRQTSGCIDYIPR